MPIYEYQCRSCGEQFDKLIRSLGRMPDEIECPACQSTEVQRLISAPAIHGSSASSSDATETDAAGATSSPVFGRKELKQAQEKKRQLRERANYEAKKERKKR